MKVLRYYASLVTGILAEIVTFIFLWEFTEREICGVMFLSILAFLIGCGAVLWFSEPKPNARRNDPVFVTLDKKTWNKGGKRK